MTKEGLEINNPALLICNFWAVMSFATLQNKTYGNATLDVAAQVKVTTTMLLNLPGVLAFIVVFSIFLCVCCCCLCLYKFTGKKEFQRGESVYESRKVIPRSSVSQQYEVA